MTIVFIQVWLGWGRSSPTGKEPGLPRERGRDDNRTREEGRFLPSLRLRDAEGCSSCSTAPPRGGEQSGEVKWRGNASSTFGLLLRKSRTNVRQCVRACPSVCLHVPVREVRRRMYVARLCLHPSRDWRNISFYMRVIYVHVQKYRVSRKHVVQLTLVYNKQLNIYSGGLTSSLQCLPLQL